VSTDGGGNGEEEPPGDALGALLAAAVAGDRRSLEDLLSAAYDLMYPVCRRVLGDDADAADAAQEALIAVSRSYARFDGRSRLSTWLYRVAVNAAIDQGRRRARRARVDLAAGTDRTGTGVTLGESVALSVDVEAALGRLSVEFRSAVVLRDMMGLDYEEISQVLGIPPGTVRSRIARGRSQLAAIWADAEGAEAGS
jgi:RNA polymerase sigma-70 factor (ECF subfamily)